MSRVTARETLFHPGVGREGAEPGTPEWAQHHMVALVSDVGHVADDLRRFAIYLDTMTRGEAWKVLRRKDGGLGFESVVAWVEAPQPFGLGTPADELLRRLDLVAEGKLVKAALRKGAPSPSVFIGQPRPLSAEKTWERPKRDDFVIPEPHPAANLFPMLSEDARRALADDIAVNGQREPIVLWEGQILDGRNRLAACDLAGVMPVFKALAHCPDPVAYVLSANLHRRHLTDDDRALCAAQMKKHYQDRAAKNHAEKVKTGGRGNKKTEASETLVAGATRVSGGRWCDLAAADWKVSADSILRADTLLAQRETLPELHDAVKVAKTVSLSGAATMAKAVASGEVTVEEVKAAVTSKATAAKLANKIRDAKPKREGREGKGRASTNATTPADDDAPASEPATPAPHPTTAAILGAANLSALDAAYSAAARVPGLPESVIDANASAYQTRGAALREQGTTTPAAPARTSTQLPLGDEAPAPSPLDAWHEVWKALTRLDAADQRASWEALYAILDKNAAATWGMNVAALKGSGQ